MASDQPRNKEHTRTVDSAQALRLKLLTNGYCPLPNRDKACYLKGWAAIDVTSEDVAEWSRRHRRFTATGLRVENGLAVIDIDVNHPVFERIAVALEDLIESFGVDINDVLIRQGKGVKEAWFLRTSESFSRLHSRRWRAPGAGPEDDTHAIEIFGGAAVRQFGAFGAHTMTDTGETLLSYHWAGPSPEDVPLSSLPKLTKAQFGLLVDTVERMLQEAGFSAVERSTKGENDVVRSYDLDDTMRFDLSDGRSVSLPELRELAKVEEHLRCSASWLEGPEARNTSRCIIGTTRSGQLTIWESAAGVTHMEASAKPRDITLELDRIAEKLKELEVRREHKLSTRDSVMVTAAKLRELYAYCPGQNRPVVPIWASSMDEGMVLSNFRISLTKYAEEEIGPRGGVRKINPVDLWVSDGKLEVVQGLRLRPDRERPIYEDEKGRWVNVYSPPFHDAVGGTAATGWRFIEHLVPDPEERRWFVQWLAHKYLRPDIPGPAVIMVAREFGTGRGTLGVLISAMFGARYVTTMPFAMVAGSSYQSQYTDWGASSLIAIVNESSDIGNSTMFTAKRNMYEHLKELVEPRPIEKRFVSKSDHFTAISFTSYLIFTNHVDALPIPPTDRRFAVLSNGGTGNEAFWVEVNDWLENPANVAAFCEELAQTDLSDYSPFVAPAQTKGKIAMIEAARSDMDKGMDAVFENLPGDVFVPSQIIAGMRQAADLYGLDYPDNWTPLVKKIIQSRAYRVGVPHGRNWTPMIEGKRYPVYAKTRELAEFFTETDAGTLSAKIQLNGSPAASGLPGNLLVGLFKAVKQQREGE